MSIQTEINRINGSVSLQSSLIAQIKSTLSNKAAGGSSGSDSRVSINTVQLTIHVVDESGQELPYSLFYAVNRVENGEFIQETNASEELPLSATEPVVFSDIAAMCFGFFGIICDGYTLSTEDMLTQIYNRGCIVGAMAYELIPSLEWMVLFTDSLAENEIYFTATPI